MSYNCTVRSNVVIPRVSFARADSLTIPLMALAEWAYGYVKYSAHTGHRPADALVGVGRWSEEFRGRGDDAVGVQEI